MVKTVLDYNTLFWGDSTLEKIEINYDKIMITVYNDVLEKNIFIECSQCVGVTEIITWDEDIIENIFLEEISDHPLLAKVKQMYGGLEAYSPEKTFEDTFWELRILLISEKSFSVICKNVCFTD